MWQSKAQNDIFWLETAAVNGAGTVCMLLWNSTNAIMLTDVACKNWRLGHRIKYHLYGLFLSAFYSPITNWLEHWNTIKGCQRPGLKLKRPSNCKATPLPIGYVFTISQKKSLLIKVHIFWIKFEWNNAVWICMSLWCMLPIKTDVAVLTTA